jgi:hypothetical protein
MAQYREWLRAVDAQRGEAAFRISPTLLRRNTG